MSLTAQQKTDLNNEIANDPKAKGYAALLPDKPGVVCDLLNEKTESLPEPRQISSRGVASALGLIDGEAFLKALENFSTATLQSTDPLLPYQPGIKRQIQWLSTEAGLDLGDALTRQLLDTLASAGIITTAAATTLKNLAMQPASRAEVLGLPFMTTELLSSRNQ
ncbi:MAG: hypothetical protein ABS69_00875 [Nitrosomonadales bacterium SCN 54-20]|nr:MAG: hypothetical protein ABS69_00875 [Nitrosomonadales bacterium SCN 54-20]